MRSSHFWESAYAYLFGCGINTWRKFLNGGVAALAGSPNAMNNYTMNYNNAQTSTCNRVIGSSVGGRLATGNNCAAKIIGHVGGADVLAPINIYSRAPYGHLKSFAYKNTPNVNIMRIHSRAPRVGLNDVPTGFTSGCRPTSTVYCRPKLAPLPTVPSPVPVPMPIPRSIMPRPIMAPAPLSIARAPIAPIRPVYKMRPPAPQILCRRPTPPPAPTRIQIVRPIVGVPYGVPTPVAVPTATQCGGAPVTATQPFARGMARYPVRGSARGEFRSPGHMPVLAGGNWRY